MKKYPFITFLTVLLFLGCNATVLMGQQAESSLEEEWSRLTPEQKETLRQRYRDRRQQPKHEQTFTFPYRRVCARIKLGTSSISAIRPSPVMVAPANPTQAPTE